MRKFVVALALLAGLSASPGFAQQLMLGAKPGRSVVLNNSSTIAVTNTFQKVFDAAPSNASVVPTRLDCLIQNTGSNPQYVFFGPTASATLAKSIKLAVGNAVSCSSFAMTLTSEVAITGTAGETFYAGAE